MNLPGDFGARKSERARVLFVAGPSGVGKTTIVRALGEHMPSYKEHHEANPYLQAVLQGSNAADTERSQQWFLDQVASFLTHASSSTSVVIDQDPVAIVHVYGAHFVRTGRLSSQAMKRLEGRLDTMTSLLGRWEDGQVRLVLDAPAQVLAARAIRRAELRSGKRSPRALTRHWEVERDPARLEYESDHPPSEEWFAAIRDRFLSYAAEWRCPVIRTDNARIDDVLHRVREAFQIPVSAL